MTLPPGGGPLKNASSLWRNHNPRKPEGDRFLSNFRRQCALVRHFRLFRQCLGRRRAVPLNSE
jgi:hypothetical protein